jgi:23S rRNA (uracil1939-C5)-methyltransferase
MIELRKGMEVELDIEKLAFGGKALGRMDGLVVFADHGVPGQRVRLMITRKKRQFAEGYVREVLSQSSHYVDPFCLHFGVCGGCSWQDLRYEEQLHWKRLHVLESLEHLAGVSEAAVLATTPSPDSIWYRNKMEFTFSNRPWIERLDDDPGGFSQPVSLALGLHVRKSFDPVLNIEACFLESPRAMEILRVVREWCRETGLPAYSTRTHQGFWRFLVIREGKRTGQTLVNLMTSSQGDHEEVVERLANRLCARFPDITTFIHSITDRKAQVAAADFSQALIGPGYIEDRLGSLNFRISPESFFQTNPLAAEQLYGAILQLGEFTGRETVWDLYCGTGSIALFIAAHVRRVVGFEVSEEAVRDAFENCRLNRIDNCSFVSGDLKEVIKHACGSLTSNDRPDVVITDPPRAGMHPQVVQALLGVAPPRIITVSCNPATLARDLVVLLEHYHIETVQPFDLFPHTPHIECLVKLKRK